VTTREARARGEILMSAAALRLIRRGAVAKGDPLQTARLAGVMAAKQTAALIPLCHPLQLSHVDVDLVRHDAATASTHACEPPPRPESRWRRSPRWPSRR
jgi:cyclic pyranopterin phosphate synthase